MGAPVCAPVFLLRCILLEHCRGDPCGRPFERDIAVFLIREAYPSGYPVNTLPSVLQTPPLIGEAFIVPGGGMAFYKTGG